MSEISIPGLYNPTMWQDHVTEHPRRRRLVPVSEGVYDLEKDQGEILRQGTPQSATNFNHMEFGILDAHMATAQFLIMMRQQGWKVEHLADVVSTLAASGIGTEHYRVEIPTTGWETDDSAGTYAVHLDIPNEEISSTHTPILAIAPEDMGLAVACGLASTAQTLGGKLRLFAQSAPEAQISAVLTLVGTMPDISESSQETGASGGVTVAQPARTTATDSDVDEMLRDVFH